MRDPVMYGLKQSWPYLLAVAFSWGLSALLIKVAPRKGWVAIPRENRWNRRIVAQFGGVPILAVFLISASVRASTYREISLLALTLGAGLLGLVDDLVGLGPAPKLIVEALLAGGAVYSGVLLPFSGNLVLDGVLTAFWIVGVANAFNMIDNIDGLAAGIGILSLAVIASLSSPDAMLAHLALLLMASISGFLFFNLNPAKVFMGDVGSLAIGFFLACSSVITATHLATKKWLVPLLILWMPLFDMLLVVCTRWLNGRKVFTGGKDHSSHRLVLLGVSERRAVAVLCSFTVVAASLSFTLGNIPAAWSSRLLVMFAIGSAIFWFCLAKKPEAVSPAIALGTNVPGFLTPRAERVFALLLDGAMGAAAFYLISLLISNPFQQRFGQLWIPGLASLAGKMAFLLSSPEYRRQPQALSLSNSASLARGLALASCLSIVSGLLFGIGLRSVLAFSLGDCLLTLCLFLLGRMAVWLWDRVFAETEEKDLRRSASLMSVHAADGEHPLPDGDFTHASQPAEVHISRRG